MRMAPRKKNNSSGLIPNFGFNYGNGLGGDKGIGNFDLPPLYSPYHADKERVAKPRRVPIPVKTQKQLMIRCRGECERCGVPFQRFRPKIHHKNRDPSDNRISNLVVLCPNCHDEIHARD